RIRRWCGPRRWRRGWPRASRPSRPRPAIPGRTCAAWGRPPVQPRLCAPRAVLRPSRWWSPSSSASPWLSAYRHPTLLRGSAAPARPIRRTRRPPRTPRARTRCFAHSNPPCELEAMQNLVRTREVDSNGLFRSTPARCGGTMSGMHERAGQPALAEDLIDPDAVIGAYYDRVPDPDDPAQQVAFGTPGHRGASLDGAFNEAHIIAITQAIVEYRAAAGVDG